VDLASEAGWSVYTTPHIAFWQAPAHQRLYLEPRIDLKQYVELWKGSGWSKIGGHPSEDLRGTLWRWLKEQGCASAADDSARDDFLKILAGRQQVHLRPGLYLKREWSVGEVSAWSTVRLATEVRTEVNRALGGIGEPMLPVARLEAPS
jgi:hypothetical protein